ncbi:MAG: hypothetical protein NTW19_13335 [Planctomycetota bacterium]|nr:hypothetical protein [Planctomycetota bacterium]
MNEFLAMAWKDVREHLKWAALLTLALAAAMAYALHGGGVGASGSSFFGESFLMISAVGFPLAGGLMGFLVVAFESRRDPWAFLIHRPVPRPTLFWGKIVAGWAMYFAAAGLPLAVAMLWLSRPGHVAQPFFWGMALPSVADWLTGAAGVPVGMLLALRPARWYGSRVAPVAACFIVGLCNFAAREFWQSALEAAVGISLLTAAARWVFVAGISPYPLNGWGRRALAVVILPAIAIGLFMALAMAGSFLDPESPDYSYHRIGFLKDGRVVHINYPSARRDELQLQDLDGKPLPDLASVHDYATLNEKSAPTIALARQTDYFSIMANATSYRHGSYRFFIPLQNYWSGGMVWYFRPDIARFVVYDQMSSNLLGSLGPDGFVPADREATARFPGVYLGTPQESKTESLVTFTGGVYRVDFQARKILATLYVPPKWETLASANEWVEVGETRTVEKVQSLVVMQGTRVLMLTKDGEPIRMIDLPAEFVKTTYGLSLCRTYEPDRYFVSGIEGQDWTGPFVLMEVEPATGQPGEIRRYKQEMPVPPPPPIYVPGAIGFAAAPAGMALYAALIAVFGRGDWHNFWRQIDPVMTALIIGMAISALVGGLACAWRARRGGMARGPTIAWGVAGAWLGVVGWLLMLCVEDVPLREKCPGCGKPRLITRERCEHCAAAFAPPAMDGSEVFVPLG